MEESQLAGVQLLQAVEGDGDVLLLIRCVGNLHDVALRVLVVASGGIETILAFHSLAILGELQYVGTLVQAVELLHIVIGRTNRSEVVEPDQVWTPLPSLDMSEERSIGSLIYHVGIALQACHEGCL